MKLRPRRFLPNLSLLLAFDAVMRRGSVTGAAADLSLTQSTVSRLLQTLEAQLGVPLFVREKKRLIANDAARAYYTEIAQALDLIQSASMGLVLNPDGGVVELAVLPTFATRWLAPRLPQFFAANPGITINMTTRLRPTNFDAEPMDVMIYYGQGDLPGARHQKLFDERLTACASPHFLHAHPIASLGDLQGLMLLQLATRPTAWQAWAMGQEGQEALSGFGQGFGRGMQMDQFNMMIQAAVSGLGVALLPDYMAQAEIAEGRLRPVLRPAVKGTGAYWLAWPERAARYKPLVALRQWLAEQVEQP